MKFLTSDQIQSVIKGTQGANSLVSLCAIAKVGPNSESTVRNFLAGIGVSQTNINQLILCLKNAGIGFGP
jgi:hypothetical protein